MKYLLLFLTFICISCNDFTNEDSNRKLTYKEVMKILKENGYPVTVEKSSKLNELSPYTRAELTEKIVKLETFNQDSKEFSQKQEELYKWYKEKRSKVKNNEELMQLQKEASNRRQQIGKVNIPVIDHQVKASESKP